MLEVRSQATASRPELASRDLVPPGPPPPAAENDGLSFSLERAGELWLIRSSEGDFHLPDVKGLQFLHHLISQPGRDVHVLDLVTGTGDRRAAGDAGEHLNDTARSQYRSRVDSLREELEEAEAFDDFERASRLREELELLTREIARAFGLGGRKRRAADSSERARTAVQRRLKDAIQRIARQAPRLASHLELSIRTGLFCTYRPAGLDY